ncbi:MAG: MinD/ParA family protein [Desulfobacteraceae bacterium]|nr:MinD/ParA family protein [Desulfobacteraceae bacterium]
MPRVITITSGKGGVGKTSISLNLALELASANQRVCLFDADLGLANINILTGIQPENDLEAVIDGSLELGDILIKNFQGIDIIPGSSGVERMADLTRAEAQRLIRSFLGLGEYDYFIFDTSAGISSQVLSFCMASQEILLVVTPEPTSLTDAYALLKVLSRKRYTSTVNVVVNQVKQTNNAKQAYSQLRDTVNRFLSVKLSPLGIVARDKHIPMAVIAQTPFLKLFPDSTASKCIHLLGRKLLSKDKNPAPMPLEQFWHRCLGFLAENQPVSPGKRPKDSGSVIPENAESKIPGAARPDNTAPKNKETDTQEPDLTVLLERMENKISLLMNEMKEIKQLVEHRANQAPMTEAPPAAPAEVELDFEAWYAKSRG